MTLAASAPTADAGAFFDGVAGGYDAAYDDPSLTASGLRERMAMTLELLGDRPGRVLDAGMGPGRTLVELARRGWEVTGVDGSEQMVAIARGRLPSAGARLLQGRLERLPFPDGTFDAVVATGVVEYVDPHVLALAEIARVLVPGGLAVVSFPRRHEPYTAWRREVLYPAVRLARRAGLRGEAPLRRRRPLTERGYDRLFAEVALNVERVVPVGRLSLVAPLESTFPRGAQSVARWLERPHSRVGHMLAAQVLFAARKPIG